MYKKIKAQGGQISNKMKLMAYFFFNFRVCLLTVPKSIFCVHLLISFKIDKKMRPDEHKSKESRKYQARQKLKGDTSAAEIAEARKKEAKARDRGLGIAAVMRRNADPQEETEEEKEERKLRQAKFSRRKLVSNADRYKEETEQGMTILHEFLRKLSKKLSIGYNRGNGQRY